MMISTPYVWHWLKAPASPKIAVFSNRHVDFDDFREFLPKHLALKRGNSTGSHLNISSRVRLTVDISKPRQHWCGPKPSTSKPIYCMVIFVHLYQSINQYMYIYIIIYIYNDLVQLLFFDTDRAFVRCSMSSFPGKCRRRCEGQIPWRFAQMISPFGRAGWHSCLVFPEAPLDLVWLFLKLWCSTPVAFTSKEFLSEGYAWIFVPRCELVVYQWSFLGVLQTSKSTKIKKKIDPWVIGLCSKCTFETN